MCGLGESKIMKYLVDLPQSLRCFPFPLHDCALLNVIDRPESETLKAIKFCI